MLKAVTSETFGTDVLEASKEKLVLVDFWATWCGPCKMLKPILERIVIEIGDKVEVVTVDVAVAEDLANEYSVSGTPTVLFFKDGEVIHQFTGVKTKPVLLEKILELS